MFPATAFAGNDKTAEKSDLAEGTEVRAVSINESTPAPDDADTLTADSTSAPDAADTLTADSTSAPDAADTLTADSTSAPDAADALTSDSTSAPDAADSLTSDSTSAPDAEREIVLALESEDVLVNGTLTKIYSRPFLYKEKTYVPFRIIAEALGEIVEYDNASRSVHSGSGKNRYTVSIDSDGVFVFNDTLFVPLREMCTDMGFSVFWDTGLICISESGTEPEQREVKEFKRLLSYKGYRDKYYVPAHIVDPYKTYSYDRMIGDIVYLSRAYPEIIDTFSIGTSAEGRDLIGFTLGTGKKRVIMCASMHAREYIATNFIMNMADKYAYAYVYGETFDNYNVRELLDKVTLVIIPMVNPDGINLAQFGLDAAQNKEYLSRLKTNAYGYRGWKANVNGVDLNGNFDLMWHEKGTPSFQGWAGPYAASEPETQAMQNFIINSDFEIFASLHTQGQVVYWMDPNCDQSLVSICKPHVDRLCKEIGFMEMPSDGTIGYSGFMTDYIRYNKKKMAMTIELCPYVGDYPYPESDFDTVERPVKNLGLILADIALKLRY